MLYSAFLIPIIISVIGILVFSKKIVIGELLANIVITSLIIVGVFFIFKNATVADSEYNSYLVTEARYYEPWETYKHQTCYRTVSCGKNCTTTVAYDCSYCDYNPAYYELIDTGGNSFYINQEEYNSYVNLWKHKKPEFVELNRDIEYYGGCGKDGDMYRVNWNGRIENSVESTISVSYDNILQTNHSAFDYPHISDEQANKLGLYTYPEVNNYYQLNVLGLDKINFPNKKYFSKRINYMNGLYGKKYSCKVFILLFKDKDINTAFKQEAYWDGGNRNEVVICIGVKSNGDIDWVKPFSWTKNKILIPNLREDIIQYKNLNNSENIVKSIEKNVVRYFKWRDFSNDFKYLTYEPTNTQIIVIYLLSIISSVLIMAWSIKNDIDPYYKN